MLDLLIRNAHIIDGTGTPGFIDLHTHYDGQVSWDSLLTPSAQHGVISVLMGNWGVGFAPACADSQDFLIRMLEGVEDIPGTALHEGINWQWESFEQYLGAIEARRCAAMSWASAVPITRWRRARRKSPAWPN
jgi:N-acyl-D-amino-acid deacylase